MNSWFESLTGLAFLDAEFLWLLTLVPLMLLLRLRSGRASVRFAPWRFADGLPGSWRARAVSLPTLLQAMAVMLAIAALARPVQREPLPRRTEGIDILLCLDRSSSMTAKDLDAERNRLEVVKEAAARFIRARQSDRIGLISFARYPDLLCPPTLDHEALLRILAELELVEGDGAEDATGIGTAVARAGQILAGDALSPEASPRAEPNRDASKVVVLLTDGEENLATQQTPDEIAPLHAAQLCARFGVRVYTIAAGTGRRQASGEWTPIDTRQVEELAARTMGRFFAARDADSLQAVYEAIDALEKSPFEEARYRIEERFLPFLLIAIAVWTLGACLRISVLEVLP